MKMTENEKWKIKRELAACLAGQREIRKVMIFGSFLTSDDPQDLDVAVFQDSDENYLPPAMRYRKLLRPVADQIPLDVHSGAPHRCPRGVSRRNQQGRSGL